jgi:voltage-gated potassium channel
MSSNKNILTILEANKALFTLVLLILFFVPLIPSNIHRPVYTILFTAIYLTATQMISKHRRLIMSLVLIAISITWIGFILDLVILKWISKGIDIALFIYIVFDLVKQVSRSKTVSARVILESINGFLMIGLVFSIVIGVLMGLNPGSFSFSNINADSVPTLALFEHYVYYAFITLTTVGYGDVLPLTPEARALSVLISLTGQFYIAVVIAFLVGKFIIHEAKQDH